VYKWQNSVVASDPVCNQAGIEGRFVVALPERTQEAPGSNPSMLSRRRHLEQWLVTWL
jgi:hypothetical protein